MSGAAGNNYGTSMFCYRALIGIAAFAAFATASVRMGFAQPLDVVGAIVAENAALAAQIPETGRDLERATLDLAVLRKSGEALEETMRRIERRAEVQALGREFRRSVSEQRRLLPKPEEFAAARDERERMLEAIGDANMRVQRVLAELADVDAAVTMRLAAQPPIPETQRQQTESEVRRLLAEQRELLARLDDLQQQALKALRDAAEFEHELGTRSDAARANLTRLLFWVPARPATRTITDLPRSIAWATSPANWREAAAILRNGAMGRPLWCAAAMLLAAGLWFGRGRLLRQLVSLAPAAVTYERYRIGHMLAAIAITFAVALPGPILLWTVGMLLGAAPDAQPFTKSLGDAATVVARLLLALGAFAWLHDRRGVAIHHFGWDPATVVYAGRALRIFIVFFAPLIFIAALNGQSHAPYAVHESLGRLTFNLAMIALAVVLIYLLRRASPVMQRLRARAPHSWPVQLHVVWFSALVALPLGIGALGAVGYFTAAAYFFGRLVESLFLVLGAAMLYGLIALWVQLQRSHLDRRRHEDAAPPARAEAPADAGSDVAKLRPPRLDIAAIGEQTQSLLNLFITLLLLAAMWWVWRDALPILSVVGDFALWTYTETVGGLEVTRPLTVGGMFLAILVAVVTVVAVRNVGALLDIVLLQRLELQADATYAIKVTTRYALAGIGITFSARLLGIGWSDVQWLIAALSVGLGFGLQEIVANFVSGLIVLAERPIRIGDTVTVGNVSGRVARIRARATVVIDSDNKEVIIPNKAFITERVVNWTLSDQTTRLLLKVGVAYGSDISQVQHVLLETVKRNPDVLGEPRPSVFFTGFSESALDFEIRAFVGTIDKRLRVQHEINFAVEQALREHGIGIPFQKRDLHIGLAPGLAAAARNP